MIQRGWVTSQQAENAHVWRSRNKRFSHVALISIACNLKRDEEAFAAILEKEANADIFAEQQHLETELMKAISRNETVAQLYE